MPHYRFKNIKPGLSINGLFISRLQKAANWANLNIYVAICCYFWEENFPG